MSLQSAAIPYRYDSAGELEILLITSRKKGKWVIPKGHVRRGMAAHSSAAKEAFEEAGVLGRTDPNPIATYVRAVRTSDGAPGLRIAVYPLAVMTEAPVWPEMHQRRRRWTSLDKAIDLVSSKGTRQALTSFSKVFGQGPSQMPGRPA
jgi:8-oxo-dGTP pyrophosphatase MutT (NUDIX family)